MKNTWNDERLDNLIIDWNCDKPVEGQQPQEWSKVPVETPATRALLTGLFLNYFKLDGAVIQDSAKQTKVVELLNTHYLKNLPLSIKMEILYGVSQATPLDGEQLAAVQCLYEFKAHDLLWYILTGDLSNLSYAAVKDDELLEVPEEGTTELRTVHEILMDISATNNPSQPAENLTEKECEENQKKLEEEYKSKANMLADKLDSSLPLTLALEYFTEKTLNEQEFNNLALGGKNDLFHKVLDQISINKAAQANQAKETEAQPSSGGEEAATATQDSFAQFSDQERRMLLIASLCDQDLKPNMSNELLLLLEDEVVEYPMNIYKLFVPGIAASIDPEAFDKHLYYDKNGVKTLIPLPKVLLENSNDNLLTLYAAFINDKIDKVFSIGDKSPVSALQVAIILRL